MPVSGLKQFRLWYSMGFKWMYNMLGSGLKELMRWSSTWFEEMMKRFACLKEFRRRSSMDFSDEEYAYLRCKTVEEVIFHGF